MHLKKSCGFDDLNTFHIKAICYYIIYTFLKLISKSFNLGIFPNVLKIVPVLPIYKGGDANQLINFRPTSILPILNKIFEHLVFNRMKAFILKFYLYYIVYFLRNSLVLGKIVILNEQLLIILN